MTPSLPAPADLPQKLLRFCSEICDGLNYLSKKGFIHRDLAARNILLDKDYHCKVREKGIVSKLFIPSSPPPPPPPTHTHRPSYLLYYLHNSYRKVLIIAFSSQIADFGMSRHLDDDSYYITKGGRIPLKWTAPEAILYRKYSSKSDVWSYGMVMYEIWSLGHKPFEEFSTDEVGQETVMP